MQSEQIPDDVSEAVLLDDELRSHTESVESTIDRLHLLAMDAATARAEYAQARARGRRGDAQALAAADRWLFTNRRAGAILDNLKCTGRWAATRTPPGITLTGCWRD